MGKGVKQSRWRRRKRPGLLEESLSPSEDPLGWKAMSFEATYLSCIHVRFSLHPEIGITVSNTIREVVKEEHCNVEFSAVEFEVT